METLEYEYRVRGWAQLYTGGSCLTFTGMMVFLALSNQESFLGVQLSQTQVNLAYWGCAVLCAALSGYVIYLGAKQKNSARKIVFLEKKLSLPKTILSQTMITINYDTINSVQRHSPARSPIKVITIKHGKTQTEIAETGFESNDVFTEVYEQLQRRIA